MKGIKIILLVGIPLCFASSIDPDMHFLEVVDPDTPPRRITGNYWNWLPYDYYVDSEYNGETPQECEDLITYVDKYHYALVFEKRVYGGSCIDITDEQKDIWAYGRVVNRD